MALWNCWRCTAAYSVGAPRCPQCGSPDYEEDGVMPKSTVESGPSNGPGEPEPVPEADAAPEPQDAPEASEPAPDPTPELPAAIPVPDSTPPKSSGKSSALADDAG